MRKFVIFFLLLSSCHRITKPPPPIPPVRRVKVLRHPVKIRVKVLTFKNSLTFGIKGSFTVNDTIRLSSGGYTIRLKNPQKARFLYYKIVDRSDEPIKNVPAGLFYVDVGAIIHFNGFTVDNRDFYILEGPYRKESIQGNIYREPYVPQSGKFELLDSKGNRIVESDDSLTLQPEWGYFYIRRGDSITGKVVFTVNTGAEGVVVLVQDLEDYIRHVLPAEMPPAFPFEALKAQAVVARTFTLAHLGKSFRYQPYDFVASVISQAFSSKRIPISDSAVDATRGIVLFYQNKIAKVFYHSTCGGHTESISCIWNTPEIPYLKGVKEGNFDLDLRDPVEIRLFIKYPPDSLICKNVENPVILRYVRKNFRWKAAFGRRDVERLVKKFTGEKIGKLKGIVPLTRGVSGRITELLISGSKKNIVINGEYRIRRLFGGLKSSLFYVDYERNEKGDIEKVIIFGGGSGHGVGMCQVGAGILAEKGFKMKDILIHYFPGVKGVKLY